MAKEAKHRVSPSRTRKQQVAVPLGVAARRRINVASRIVEYLGTSARTDIITLPLGKLRAKNATSGVSPISDREVDVCLAGLVSSGKIVAVRKFDDRYTFRLAADFFSRKKISSKFNHKKHLNALPDPSEMMQAVLAAINEGKQRYPNIRAAVAKVLDFPISLVNTTSEGDSFNRRLGLIITNYLENGYAERQGKEIRITTRGTARLCEARRFGDSEFPKRLIKVRSQLSGAPHQASSISSPKRLFGAIPEMLPDKLVALWRNSLRILNDARQTNRHESAKRILAAVEERWSNLTLGDEEFLWPTTEIGQSRGATRGIAFRGEGMLSYLEYRVGKTYGLSSVERQAILERVFKGKLPAVFDPTYMAEWGAPKSALRLRKMAESLAAFVRNAKRNDELKLNEAIRQWEQDLLFLYERYYVGKFGFGWPITTSDMPLTTRERR